MLDNISKKALIVVAIVGSLVASLLAGGMIILAGGPLYMGLELSGFVLYVEIMYWALAAAFAGIRATIRRRQLMTRGVSMEEKIANVEARLQAARERNRQRTNEANARLAAARERNKQRGELIKSGICPACHKPMILVQRRGLVVASPCNHILYEGRLKNG
jgi:hypothetical protein